MIDMNEIFENNCFSMGWTEANTSNVEQQAFIPQRKDLQTLLAELEDIKNTIEDAKAKKWYLEKLSKYYEEGFARQ